jgi:putative peptide-modifying radical SAM enzyme
VVPWEVEYPIDNLRRFISDDAEPIIAFYGGEPLLNVGFIEQIMDEFTGCRFVVQSNGTLTRKLDPEYWLKFDSILLSIDGRRTTTDHYRGASVYKRVIDSARWLSSIGFRDDLIARMTVSELSDLYLDVKHLLSLNLFDHIHWQLNVIWSSCWRDFHGWCDRSYIQGIDRLVRLWMRELRKGKVVGLVPFISILGAMIRNERISRPPCGAGIDSLAILTNGDILACPIAVDASWARLGNISSKSRDEVMGKVKIGEPCVSCDHLRYCGGRCLYTHHERLWDDIRTKKICDLTIHMIKELSSAKDEVLSLLDRGVISSSDLEYPPFNNTTEIVP